MTISHKGFDPLSSLFDEPELSPPPGGNTEDATPDPPPAESRASETIIPENFTFFPGLEAPEALKKPVEPKPVEADDETGPTLATAAVAAEVDEPGPSAAEELAKAVGRQAAQLAAEDDAVSTPEPDSGSAKRPAPQKSRIDSLAASPRRLRPALEAARVAAANEAAAEEARQELERAAANAVVRGEHPVIDTVDQMIGSCLPGLGDRVVVNAIEVTQRTILSALWKAHRAKFLGDGELERAAGAAAVVGALGRPKNRLVAAHVVTMASDYLVWFELESQAMIAAFSDAKAYFAGTR